MHTDSAAVHPLGHASDVTSPHAVTHPWSAIAGLLAIFVGGAVLVGWTIGNEFLKGAGHAITMKPNAAVGLIACGISLMALSGQGEWRLRLGAYVAVVAAALGAVTFSEHLVGWDLGVDQLLFTEPPGAPAVTSPARMGPNASLSLALAGSALIASAGVSMRAVRIAQALAMTVITLATIALVGYGYSAQELYAVARYTAVAWPTALTLLIIGTGILALRSDVGPVAILRSNGPGGMMMRRLLIPAIVVPFVLGYVRVAGQQRGMYDTGLGTAILVVSLILVLTGLTWSTAARLDESERIRDAARAERDELLVRERSARQQAEHANRLKDEFLAALSHELRTPLNTMLGWTEMLRSNAVPMERHAQAVEVVARNGGMLVRLIEDILDLSRTAGGQLHLERVPTDVIAVAGEALESMRAEAAAKGITLESRLGDHRAIVIGDSHRLRQIMSNLLSNSLKFTPPGGFVRMEARTDLSSVNLILTDNGKGVDPGFLPHMFERFRQEDGTTTREHGGLGLGLAIVRELTELHGGTVRAASAGPGQGTTFVVSLPLARDAAHAEA